MKTVRWLGAVLLVSSLTSFGAAADNAPAKDNGPAKHEEILLWSGVAPGDKGDLGEEKDKIQHKPDAGPNSDVRVITSVSKPMITIYRPAADKNTGAAAIVCPGGAYLGLAYDLEGTEVCEWLNSIGVTGVLLKYRVPGRGEERFTAPLQDAQRALGLVRQHASAWGIDPKRIGMLGFSAGGHLSAALSNNNEKRLYPKVDAADEESCRPDFAILVYPGGLIDKADSTKLASEMKVDAHTPPTFLVMAEDDPVKIENVLVYTQALRAAKVPAELHIYPTGGHGYGTRHPEKPVSTWPLRAAEWLKAEGFLSAKKTS